ncbi:MAG: ABC transporter permease, partial [Rhizobiaceae bacterium]|nr:ABC transporter permease [Rhizobiaceae bacterium]
MRLINRIPSRGTALLLGALPFVAAFVTYAVASAMRLAENPADKLLPSFAQIGRAFHTMAFTADVRSGDYLLWLDTAASLGRLGGGMLIATLMAV